MKCRTPTKTANISPFRGGVISDNPRGHSPMKFINRANNQQISGFFRTENTTVHYNLNQKYTTCGNNNDRSVIK